MTYMEEKLNKYIRKNSPNTDAKRILEMTKPIEEYEETIANMYILVKTLAYEFEVDLDSAVATEIKRLENSEEEND